MNYANRKIDEMRLMELMILPQGTRINLLFEGRSYSAVGKTPGEAFQRTIEAIAFDNPDRFGIE